MGAGGIRHGLSAACGQSESQRQGQQRGRGRFQVFIRSPFFFVSCASRCPASRKSRNACFRRKQASGKWAQQTAQKSRWGYFLRKIPTMAPQQASWLADRRPPRLLTRRYWPDNGILRQAPPLTVTGSLGTCTRFPFTPAARLGTEGADFLCTLYLISTSESMSMEEEKIPG